MLERVDGVIGQNKHLDLEDRYWKWPEARHLRTLAADIRLERSKAGEASPLCDKFLSLCEARDSNTPGDRDLPLPSSARCETEADLASSREKGVFGMFSCSSANRTLRALRDSFRIACNPLSCKTSYKRPDSKVWHSIARPSVSAPGHPSTA